MNKRGDLPDDTELQRYMDFVKFVDLLSSKSLFLSRVSRFEDQLEGGLTPSYTFQVDGGSHRLRIAVNNHAIQIQKMAKLVGSDVSLPIEDSTALQQEYDNWQFDTIFGKYSKRDTTVEHVYRQHREWVDVSCWHTNKTESMAMWKIYGGSENAVCLITDVSRLIEHLKPAPGYELTIAPVEYITTGEDEFKSIHNSLTPLLHKSDFYSFEQEVRILGYDPSSPLLEVRSENESGTRVEVSVKDIIKEIRVSPNARTWFIELVTSIAKKFEIDAPVNVSKMAKMPTYGY